MDSSALPQNDALRVLMCRTPRGMTVKKFILAFWTNLGYNNYDSKVIMFAIRFTNYVLGLKRRWFVVCLAYTQIDGHNNFCFWLDYV